MWEYYYIILYLIGIVGVAMVKYFYDLDRKIKKQLTADQVVNMSGVKEEQIATVKGEVCAQDRMLTAPFSGKPCVCYQLLVYQIVSGDYGESKAQLLNKERSLDFFIRDSDSTTDAHLRMWSYKASLQRDVIHSPAMGSTIPKQLVDFMARSDHKSKDILGRNKDLIFEEGIIEPGEKVYVKARGNWKETSYYDKKTLVMSGTNDEPLIISDRADILKT